MYHFLTLGYDCSPAGALREMGLREYALPFDWVISTISSLEECFKDNFSKFHTGLHFNYNKKRLIDAYGFEFPHDYPLETAELDTVSKDDTFFSEEEERGIVEDWEKYYSTVKEKYERRIQRFLTIVQSDKPIMVLCRYGNSDVMILQELFKKCYNKHNIVFINSHSDVYISSHILSCHTERNGKWNETSVWKEAIDTMNLKNMADLSIE